MSFGFDWPIGCKKEEGGSLDASWLLFWQSGGIIRFVVTSMAYRLISLGTFHIFSMIWMIIDDIWVAWRAPRVDLNFKRLLWAKQASCNITTLICFELHGILWLWKAGFSPNYYKPDKERRSCIRAHLLMDCYYSSPHFISCDPV